MSMRNWVLASLLALAILILARTTEHWWTSAPPTPTDTLTIERNEPDLYGESVTFSELRVDGTLQYQLSAATIHQFDADQLTRLLSPDLHLTSVDRPPWNIVSAHGYIRQGQSPVGVAEDVVFLREDVRMSQHHPLNGVIVIRSESIYIYPDREYAQTDQDVMIDTEVGRTIAAGMVADMAASVLKLSSSSRQRVHTIVLPEQFKKS